jgi:hypothetical protein
VVLTLTGSAYPNSGIGDAKIAVAVGENSISVTLSAGGHASAQMAAAVTAALLDLIVSVKLNNKTVQVYVSGVPQNCDIHVFRVTPSLFFGMIEHSQATAAGCMLRCDPASPFQHTTRCIRCKNGNLTFKLCC